MAWALIDDDFPNHPKVVQAGTDAAWLFVCGLCYCRKYHTGGFIPAKALASLGAGGGHKRLATALVSAGLWDGAEDGFSVHDYAGFYADEDDKAMKDAVRQQKREAGRKGGLESGKSRVSNTHGASHGASSTGGMGWSGDLDHLLEEKKRDADFGNFWAAYPRKDGKQAARVEWVRLKPSDDEQKAIAADLERRGRSSQWLKDGGQFIPHARTYLHQRRWEDGFTERPRLSERTVNVIKGFEDPAEVA
jgi:hypothetical protein